MLKSFKKNNEYWHRFYLVLKYKLLILLVKFSGKLENCLVGFEIRNLLKNNEDLVVNGIYICQNLS